MADVVISEFMDEEILADLARAYTVHYEPTLWRAPDRLAAQLGEARALIVRNRTRVDAPLLARGPKLKVIGRMGVGLDNIDTGACRRRGIAVCTTPGANATSVAEYVMVTTLVLLRPVYGESAAVRAGGWPREALAKGCEAAGKTMGLIGFGATGRAVARRARAFEMDVLAHDPLLEPQATDWAEARPTDFDALLALADVVSLHLPLMPETRNLIDARAIGRMKPGALLINAARGGIVDEGALIAALRAGRLGGAALDVFAEEPLNREKGQRFDGVPNLILTPHIAGVTGQSNRRVAALTVAAVRKELEARKGAE